MLLKHLVINNFKKKFDTNFIENIKKYQKSQFFPP